MNLSDLTPLHKAVTPDSIIELCAQAQFRTESKTAIVAHQIMWSKFILLIAIDRSHADVARCTCVDSSDDEVKRIIRYYAKAVIWGPKIELTPDDLEWLIRSTRL